MCTLSQAGRLTDYPITVSTPTHTSVISTFPSHSASFSQLSFNIKWWVSWRVDTTCDVVVIEIASDHFYSTVAHHHGEHTTLYKIIRNVCTKPQREYITILYSLHTTRVHIRNVTGMRGAIRKWSWNHLWYCLLRRGKIEQNLRENILTILYSLHTTRVHIRNVTGMRGAIRKWSWNHLWYCLLRHGKIECFGCQKGENSFAHQESVGQRFLTWEMSAEERSCLEGLCTWRSKQVKGSREQGVNASSHSCFRFLHCGVRETGRRWVREVVTNSWEFVVYSGLGR